VLRSFPKSKHAASIATEIDSRSKDAPSIVTTMSSTLKSASSTVAARWSRERSSNASSKAAASIVARSFPKSKHAASIVTEIEPRSKGAPSIETTMSSTSKSALSTVTARIAREHSRPRFMMCVINDRDAVASCVHVRRRSAAGRSADEACRPYVRSSRDRRRGHAARALESRHADRGVSLPGAADPGLHAVVARGRAQADARRVSRSRIRRSRHPPRPRLG